MSQLDLSIQDLGHVFFYAAPSPLMIKNNENTRVKKMCDGSKRQSGGRCQQANVYQ